MERGVNGYKHHYFQHVSNGIPKAAEKNLSRAALCHVLFITTPTSKGCQGIF